MQDAVVKKIKSKIAHGKFGEVYFVSSFPQYDVEYVTKLLAIFEREGQKQIHTMLLPFQGDGVARLSYPGCYPGLIAFTPLGCYSRSFL